MFHDTTLVIYCAWTDAFVQDFKNFSVGKMVNPIRERRECVSNRIF